MTKDKEPSDREHGKSEDDEIIEDSQDKEIAESVIIAPFYNFWSYDSRDIGDTLVVLDTLNEMANGDFLNQALEQFSTNTDNPNVVICQSIIKHYGRKCRELTELIKTKHPDVYKALLSPKAIVSKGLAIELVYESQPLYKNLSPTRLMAESALFRILFELAFSARAEWLPHHLFRLQIYHSNDNETTKTIAEYLHLSKISNSIYLGSNNLFDTIDSEWSNALYPANPIVCTTPMKLKHPEKNVLQGLVMSILLISELYNVWSIVDDVLAHIFLARYRMSGLLWSYLEKSKTLKWFMFFDRHILTELLDRYYSSSRKFVVEDKSPMGKAIWRIWGGSRFEHLFDSLNNWEIYNGHMMSGILKCGASSHPLVKDFNMSLYQDLGEILIDKLGELREPLRDFGADLDNRVSVTLSQLKVEVAAKGVQIAVFLGIISIIIAILAIGLSIWLSTL